MEKSTWQESRQRTRNYEISRVKTELEITKTRLEQRSTELHELRDVIGLPEPDEKSFVAFAKPQGMFIN
jgi:hypothetical protein